MLLDIPHTRDVPWLEPGDHVTADDLLAAETAQDVHAREGDLLLIRVGHQARRRDHGTWNAAEQRVGLHPNAIQLLAERRNALVGGDGNNGSAPASSKASASQDSAHRRGPACLNPHCRELLTDRSDDCPGQRDIGSLGRCDRLIGLPKPTGRGCLRAMAPGIAAGASGVVRVHPSSSKAAVRS